ncbi:Rhodanese-like domain-containing protein 6 [Platanthera guangdongensis]|uniref:Rhodanese-like domain-containing protein 6 n=1 Tax=Platanthera guangdongensis TaxID=2320717 RepID=A0ABR2MRV8_9ASPA
MIPAGGCRRVRALRRGRRPAQGSSDKGFETTNGRISERRVVVDGNPTQQDRSAPEEEGVVDGVGRRGMEQSGRSSSGVLDEREEAALSFCGWRWRWSARHYMVGSRDTWSSFLMVVTSKERILFLITGNMLDSDIYASFCFRLPYKILISVGSRNTDVLGTCLLCGSPFDDYSSRSRCSYCRMLVLVCHSCQHRKLRILCLHGFRQNASSFKGRTSSLSKKLRSYVEFIFVDAPHELPLLHQPTKSCPGQISPSPSENCRRRFAWLISPNSSSSDESSSWRIVDQQFDPLQYKTQTEGFEVSNHCLQDLISTMGPFDGILGFSQGAAMAALFCEEQQRGNERVSDFRFAVLCSGYSAASNVSDGGFIKCASLHVFGDRGGGRDRQINHEASRELADLFDKNSSVTVEHDMGHIIPTKSPYIDQMKAFFMSFL